MLMMVSSRRDGAFEPADDAEPGHDRTHNIHDEFRSVQDLHRSGSEVLEGSLHTKTMVDPLSAAVSQVFSTRTWESSRV